MSVGHEEAAGLQKLSFDGPVAVIGDIHGCVGALKALLELLGEMPVIVLGDVGDRGPDTRAVIETLIGRRAVGVRGNHEEWLTAWARGDGFDSFALNGIMGGRATLDSYGVTGRSTSEIEAERWLVPGSHLAWLEGLAEAIDLEVAGEKYWVVHGGVPTSDALQLPPSEVVPWLAQNAPLKLHGYRHKLRGAVDLGRPIIVGHQPLAEPMVTERVIALDTGAGTRGEAARLTALVLPGARIVSVPAE